jgi:hypothetical protein
MLCHALATSPGQRLRVAARDGAPLTNPFAFEELYGDYRQSGQVPPKESILSDWGRAVIGRLCLASLWVGINLVSLCLVPKEAYGGPVALLRRTSLGRCKPGGERLLFWLPLGLSK